MIPRLHVITNDSVLTRPDLMDRAQDLMSALGPALAFHVRGRRTGGRRIHEVAGLLQDPAAEAGSLLLVNDRVDVALALGLGVHLKEDSLPVAEARRQLGDGSVIGASVHDVDLGVRAQADGTDYLLVGTIYITTSHPGKKGVGPEFIQAVGSATDLPLVAIGGITLDRVADVRKAGAHGIATIRAVWEAADPVEAATGFLAAMGA